MALTIDPKILCTLSAIVCTFPIIKGLTNSVSNQEISSLTNSIPKCGILLRRISASSPNQKRVVCMSACVKKKDTKREIEELSQRKKDAMLQGHPIHNGHCLDGPMVPCLT